MKRTPILLRVPEELAREVKQAADDERRSVNAQITVILEDWVRLRKAVPAGA